MKKSDTKKAPQPKSKTVPSKKKPVKYQYPSEVQIKEILKGKPHKVMYVSNVKGGVQVEFQGHLFDHRFSKTVNDRKAFIYRCNQAQKKNCVATVIVYDKTLYEIPGSGNHNHPTTNFGPVKMKV